MVVSISLTKTVSTNFHSFSIQMDLRHLIMSMETLSIKFKMMKRRIVNPKVPEPTWWVFEFEIESVSFGWGKPTMPEVALF